MPIATAMEEGARIPKDAIDPDLVKLSRKRPKIGVITAAGLVFLCGFFIVRLWGDRVFGGASTDPTKTTVAEVLAGKAGLDGYVSIAAEPLVSHAMRTTTAKGNLGLRVVPARGTSERLWLVVNGDPWDEPHAQAYVGRLRKLDDLAFARYVRAYANENPRPLFATAAAVHAGGTIETVGGDKVTVADGDKVAIDLVDPNAATIIASINELRPVASWKPALERAGLAPQNEQVREDLKEIRYDIVGPDAVASTMKALEKAELWAARVDPVMRHYQTTWATLKTSPAGSLRIDDKTLVPDAQVEFVGLYTARAIPSDAYAIVVGEKPADYWYVLPITIGLGLLGLLFIWALVRAVQRDLLKPRVSSEPAPA